MTDDYRDDDAPPPDADDRTPPHDLAAEQFVVGSMLLDRSVIDDVIDQMQPADFYIPKHEKIAKAIGTLHRQGKPTDVIAVGNELQRVGELSKAGGVEYLHTLTSMPSTTVNAGYYAQLVAEKAVLRRLVEAGTRITNIGYASEGEVVELLASAAREIEEAAATKRVALRTIGEGIDSTIDALSEKPDYNSTGWTDLDELIGGFGPGELHVYAARPGDGKTIALLQLAAQLAHTGLVALCSLEMSDEALKQRMLAQYGPVNLARLRTHTLSKDDWVHIAEASKIVADAPIFVEYDPKATTASIRSHARAVARRGKLAGIFVDYLQIVKGGEGKSRDEIVGDIMQDLKDLAVELKTTVVVAAQLNRGGDGGARGPRGKYLLPTMRDLRESGWIEQIADVIVLLSRDKDKNPHALDAVVAKNRNGRIGRFQLIWQGEFARLRNPTWSPSGGLFPRADLD